MYRHNTFIRREFGELMIGSFMFSKRRDNTIPIGCSVHRSSIGSSLVAETSARACVGAGYAP